jgi:hypothetical protein
MNEKEKIFLNTNIPEIDNNIFSESIIKKLPSHDLIRNILNDSDSDQKSEQELRIKENKINDGNITYNLTIGNDSNFINEEKGEKEEKELQSKEVNFKIEIEKRDMPPPQYSFNKIKNEVFLKFDLKPEIKESFIENDIIRSLEYNISDEFFLSKKTRNRNKVRSREKIKKKLGRKKNDEKKEKKDIIDIKHNKESPDNIIKKIKSKLLETYLLNFINSLLSNAIINKEIINPYSKINIDEKDKEKLIKKIDYKQIVDNMKKESNLELLRLSLKDLLSKDISSKYSTLSKDFNKNIIDVISLNEKENEIISFVFNMTFGEWFDIFTFKKEIRDVKVIDEDTIKFIMQQFERVDKLLTDIYESHDKNYFSVFAYLIYNYERWFFIKQSRKSKQKKDKTDKQENKKKSKNKK